MNAPTLRANPPRFMRTSTLLRSFALVALVPISAVACSASGGDVGIHLHDGGDASATNATSETGGDDAGADATFATDAPSADGAADDSSGGDALSSDALSSDATSDDSSGGDALSSDALSSDATSDDSSGSDALSSDAPASEVASSDAADAGAVDGGADTGVADTGVVDTGAPDTMMSLPCDGGMTTLSGVTYAPNGTDPIPNVLVYIAPDSLVVPPAPTGVTCTPCTIPFGAIASTTSKVDGTFTLASSALDAGGSYTLVIATGGFRRVIRHLTFGACASVALPPSETSFPGVSSGEDIAPKIAVGSETSTASPSPDVNDKFVQVLTKIGMKYDTYLPNKKGTAETGSDLLTLIGNASALSAYDMLIVPCGSLGDFSVAGHVTSTMASNLSSWLKAGGRLYASDLAYEVIANADPADFTWASGKTKYASDDPADVGVGYATGTAINVNLVDPGLLAWMQAIGVVASGGTTIPVYDLRDPWGALSSITTAVDPAGIPYGRTFVTGSVSWYGASGTAGPATTRPLTVQVDVPGASGARCGRTVFTSYHVQSTSSTSTTLSAQERVLEYLFFQLNACQLN
jgi:hypothetical protein